MNLPGLPPPRPIPMKDRSTLVFVERAQLDVADGAFVAMNADGTRTQIPIGGLAGVMLEPGARISHAAVALAARTGTLITWVGEAGVRLYSAGQPGGARADRLLWQARLALDDAARLRVVRKMYALRFGEEAPLRRSIDQLRGIEGVRVRKSYELLAQMHGVAWKRRSYDPEDWEAGDIPNRCLSAATACLHGLAEAAVLAAGYAPAIGFLHSGKPLSFVYDIADLWKLDTVVPEAFRIAGLAARGKLEMSPDRAVRLACRDVFRKSGLLAKIIPRIEEVLEAGELPRPNRRPRRLARPSPTMPRVMLGIADDCRRGGQRAAPPARASGRLAGRGACGGLCGRLLGPHPRDDLVTGDRWHRARRRGDDLERPDRSRLRLRNHWSQPAYAGRFRRAEAGLVLPRQDPGSPVAFQVERMAIRFR